MFLPPDLRDWVSEDHLAHFVLEVVESMDLSSFQINWRGTGSAQYPPSMMLALLVYCYATGRFSSREIEIASHYDVAVRYICANTHPDHDTICTFRRRNREAFEKFFTHVLEVAVESKVMKKVGTISVDGTKIHANASKHSAVSYKRANEMLSQLENEVAQLMKKAEEADASRQVEGTVDLPAEIARRQDRKAQIKKAVAVIEARNEEKLKEKKRAYEEKVAHKLKSPEGAGLYRLRKQTVEPVFGIIKQCMRFRQFLMRGKDKVSNEWNLVCTAYNLKRTFNRINASKTAAFANSKPCAA